MARQSMPCIPEINVGSCCCCFSLRTGSFILGWISQTISVIFTVSIVVGAIIFASKRSTDSSKNADFILFLYIIALVPFVCSVVINYLFIRGIIKKKPVLMYPYIYLYFVGIILSILFSIFATIFMALNNIEGPVIIFRFIIRTVIQTAFQIHFFMVVTAYCQQLLTDQDSRNQQVPSHNMRV